MSFGFVPDTYADHTPIQPNALVSYNSITNEIQVEWDFTTGGVNAPETCLLKGDFWFFTDLNVAYNTDQRDSDTIGNPFFDHVTRITGFTPIHYSVVSSNPTIFDTLSEVIPCTGSTRINLDTVMSHPSNVFQDGVTPREDLQIFFSFYSLHEGKDFTFDIIDEIFVFYTPNDTWSTLAKNYACGGQIGNTIYIDQSAKGIHGNNGDNCDQYLELEDDQYVDIVDGTPAYNYHDGEFLLIIKVVTSEPINKKSGGGGNESQTRPTFGISHETYKQLVDNSFSFNSNYYSISDNFWTPFKEQTIRVNQTNSFSVKVYANEGLRVQEFLFGIPQVGDADKSELGIEVFYDYDGIIDEIRIIQETNIIDISTLEIEHTKSKCQSSDTDEVCDTTHMSMKFLEPLKDSVMAIKATDFKNRYQFTYLNDGFNVVGNSLNSMQTDDIMGTEKYEGLIKVTQKEKYSDIWIAADGREFQKNDSGSFVWINQTFEKLPSSEKTVMTRIHTEFYKILDLEQKKAVLIFDSSKIVSELKESWTYDDPKSPEEQQAELDQRMAGEIARVTPLIKDYTLNQYLYTKDSYNHWNYYDEKSLSEILHDDLAKKLQLQQEKYQSKLDAKQQYITQ